MTEPNATTEHFAGAAEEYTQLRLEMTNIQANVRTLWWTIHVIFFTALGVLGSVLGRDDFQHIKLLAESGVLNFASIIFSVFIWTGLYLSYRWFLHSLYLGSYLIVFHEEHSKKRFPKWLTRHRAVKDRVLVKARNNIPAALFWTANILLLIASLPAGFSYGLALKKGVSGDQILPFWLTFDLFVGIAILILVMGCRLRSIHHKQYGITNAWRQIRLNENRNTQQDE